MTRSEGEEDRAPAADFAASDRIADLVIDDGAAGPPGEVDLENERRVAIFDILEENRFRLTTAAAPAGPFRLRLAVGDQALRFEATGPDGAVRSHDLPLAAFSQLVSDYLAVCEDYRDAIRRLAPSQIEALDAARRAAHSEASAGLQTALAPFAAIDRPTARRLFTLICALRVGAPW